MPSLPVRNVDLPNMNKCHLILEWSFINAPVVTQYYAHRQEIAVSIAHILTGTAHQSRKN